MMPELLKVIMIPVECGQCKAVGAGRESCRSCSGYKFRCFQCGNRIYPDVQYSIASDCLCVESIKQNQLAKLP